MMFWGFRSRWMTPCACACCTARVTSRTISTARVSEVDAGRSRVDRATLEDAPAVLGEGAGALVAPLRLLLDRLEADALGGGADGRPHLARPARLGRRDEPHRLLDVRRLERRL